MNQLTFNEIYEQALSENTVPPAAPTNNQQAGNIGKDIQELLKKHQANPQFFQELDKQLKTLQQQQAQQQKQQAQQQKQQPAQQNNQQQAKPGTPQQPAQQNNQQNNQQQAKPGTPQQPAQQNNNQPR
jgi:hypothetical protein